jgi:Transglutaminase-like superfamily
MMRRVRRARSVLAGPADLWLALRMAGWLPLLPVLKYALPLPRLARLMSAAGRGPRQPERERRIVTLGYWLYKFGTLGRYDCCLERSLVTYRYLSRANAAPELVVGFRKGEGRRTLGHVWVLLDGEPVHDSRADLDEYVPLAAFGPNGAVASSPPAAQRP